MVYDMLYDLNNKDLTHNQFNDKLPDIIYDNISIECKNWENTTNLTGLLVATQIRPKFEGSQSGVRIALFKNDLRLTRRAKALLAKYSIIYMVWDSFRAWIRSLVRSKGANVSKVIYGYNASGNIYNVRQYTHDIISSREFTQGYIYIIYYFYQKSLHRPPNRLNIRTK